MLVVNHVTKKYGNFVVLENIDLEFSPGIYGLLAANGSGKTTLMKMLATLSHPTRGEILWNGTEINHLGESYRNVIGYLPQEVGFYPNYSPSQYLEYISVLKGIEKSIAKERIPELLALVGLSDVANKKMKKFSGGMIQRVGIAQALLNDPEILFLDEPTAGLDPKERVRFRNILAKLSKEKIVILSTHIVSDVETVANQLILIKDHKVAFQGGVTDLCNEFQGRIYEMDLNLSELDIFEEKHFILVRKQTGDQVTVRFVDGEIPTTARAVLPSLEEVFLAIYR